MSYPPLRLTSKLGPASLKSAGGFDMEQKDEFRTIQLQELRDRIDKGLAEAQQGETVDGETFVQGLIDDLDSREATRKAG